MRKNDLIFNSLLVPLDFILLVGAAFGAYFLRVSSLVAGIRPVLFNIPLGQFFSLVAALAVFFIIIFALSGLYLIKRSTPIFQELTKITIAVSASMALLIIFMFFNREWFDSRFILLAAWILAIFFISLGRIMMRIFRIFLLYKKQIGLENLLILGQGERTKIIKKQIIQNKKLGLNLIDVLSTPELNPIKSLHNSKNLQLILVAEDNFDRKEIMRVVNFCEEAGIQFSYIPDMFGSIVAEMSFDILEGIPVVSVKPSSLDGWAILLKRFIDIIGASLILVILSPIFLILPFAIKWETKGSMLVKLKRVSSGKEFSLYKFRSMINNAEALKPQLASLNEREDGPLFKVSNDPRITKVGKYMRARRFDELPQLFNVLRGHISLVGPRPHEPKEIEQYEDYHKKVLVIKSGITGMAQVSGASELSFDEEVRLDRHYIENWSLKKDIVILIKTLKLLLFDKSGV